MDELRGPTVQIVLHVKEGLGFGFLRTPFVVSGSLNGYVLETDPVAPSHAPVFDAELVWEADKRRFRSLRVQNVPIKVEVFSLGTQGRKDKVGYFLLSLLSAQPCPSNKIVDLKHTWQRLLGIKTEGKCCQPQLQISLSVEDRVNTVTPRNELQMFHSNEVAYLSVGSGGHLPVRSILMTLNEYILESQRQATTVDLQPQLLCDEGLIQLGRGRQLFVLSFVIGAVDNLDLLLPEGMSLKDATDFCVTYSVFTHDIMTDRVNASTGGSRVVAHFNQRTSLRLRSSLGSLAAYFAECPHLVIRVAAKDQDAGICSMDLRKLIPTDNIEIFTTTFCNHDNALTIYERCFLLRCDEMEPRVESRRPYVDVEMTLKYVETVQEKNVQKQNILSARSVTQLESGRKCDPMPQDVIIDCRSGSCTNLNEDIGNSYTNMGVTNSGRYKNAAGDAYLQTTELADLIRKMYESFTTSQEKLLEASKSSKPKTTSDMQIQVEPIVEKTVSEGGAPECGIDEEGKTPRDIKLDVSKSDTCIGSMAMGHGLGMGVLGRDKEVVKMALSAIDRDTIMQRFVDELEDWKEKQQEMFKCQLKRKEEYHLEMLSEEWTKKRVELETRLSKGVEQCRALAADLSRATEDFRLRGYRNTEREKKLQEAKKALEAHYTAKYQELRLASQQMEDDMKHQMKLKDMKIEELEAKVQQLEKQIDVLKNNIKNSEKEAESKYSGLTKDQTASLIQELRCLEEKLDSAVQSKAFFKEQWGRAVRELHLSKLHTRQQMLQQLKHDRRQLGQMGLDQELEEFSTTQSAVDVNKLKDDYYVDILANTPTLNTHSIINNQGPDMDMYDTAKIQKSPLNEKLNGLITQRDRLIQQDNPNEEKIKQLNHDIRNMLLNCGT